ncbi:MAG TPA: hypothetical protein EYO51_04470 [Methylococcaceae bacterium]|nr:hypothetical protein [Methylococcaceae bacterium]
MANEPLVSRNSNMKFIITNISVTMKKKLQHICFVLLVTSFSASAYGGSCWDAKPDFDNCKLKAEQGDPDAQMLLELILIPTEFLKIIKNT